MEYIINNKDIQIGQNENSFNLQYRIINQQMYLDKLINFQFLNIIHESLLKYLYFFYNKLPLLI